jgi:HD domain
MDTDRSAVIASLGGEAAVKEMTHEARADELEDYLAARLQATVAARQNTKPYPTVADHENRVDKRGYRRGVGWLFVHKHYIQDPDADPPSLTVHRLPPMPPKPSLIDFFNHRFMVSAHLLQSARLAQKRGAGEEVILACLLHDAGQNLIKADHGYWGAQIIEPYVSERVAFAVRYHQALRFFPDPSVGYEYPESYNRIFGVDYVPLPHVARDYEYARNHKWYMDARLVTLNDLYSFDPSVQVSIGEFTDIIGRHFRQPKEGLGNDNTPVTHMWRTIINPDAPL